MDIMATAIECARKAGLLLRQSFGSRHKIEYKGAIDLVTDQDKSAESLIVDIISGRFPNHGILTEEREEKFSSSGYRWIIDPLDGTTNYAHNFPFFSVSIAFEDRGDIVAGVVYVPVLEELFVAAKGRGATLNGQKIEVSDVRSLSHSLLATGFPYDMCVSRNNNFNNFENFSMEAQAIRRAGSAAIDLCYVACGRLEGYWELKLRAWDVAAGSLIVREAGGIVTDFLGGTYSISGEETMASNGLIHKEMLAVLKKN